uniref:Uncharacterized protein n=1 Tax=Biomphalaria glabrata TaxID=6526 RepID=A0A2C9LAH0_BIOGL
MVKRYVSTSKYRFLLIFSLYALIVFQVSEASEIAEVKETDTVTFVCPRQPQWITKLHVNFTDGHKEWYADFYSDSTCATFNHMKCSTDGQNNLLTLPVSNTSRSIASYSCGDSLIYTVSFYGLLASIRRKITYINIIIVRLSLIDTVKNTSLEKVKKNSYHFQHHLDLSYQQAFVQSYFNFLNLCTSSIHRLCLTCKSRRVHLLLEKRHKIFDNE